MSDSPISSIENSGSEKVLKWLSALLLPLVLLYLGYQFTSANNERAIQAKFVELALQILRESPTDDRKDLRAWAIKIVDRYAGVPLSQKAADDLLSRVPIAGEYRYSKIESQTSPTSSSTKTITDIRREMQEWKCKHQASEMGYAMWKRLCDQ